MLKSLNPLLISSLIFLSFAAKTQNLVPNPSFENVNSQPCGYIQNYNDFVSIVNDWTLPNGGTSDILSNVNNSSCYTNCFSTSTLAVGEQLPRTGVLMAGIVSYESEGCLTSSINYREYLQVKLKNPLTLGDSYFVRFYVSLAESSEFATNNLGLFFSDFEINSNLCSSLSFNPQIKELNIISDSVNWIEISGYYTAVSASKYIIIGNFSSNNGTDSVPTFHNNPNSTSYYFIDDVLVKNACLNNSPDTTVCYNSPVTLHAYSDNFIGWAESSSPNVILSTDTSLTVTPTQNTTYFVYGTCDTNQVTVFVKPPPQINLGNDTTLCGNEKLDLTSNIQSTSYLWQDSSSNSSFTVLTPGIYWLEVYENNCLYRDTIEVNYYPSEIFSFQADTLLFCLGDTVNFQFNLNNANYLWSNNSITTSIKVTQAQKLWLEVQQNGCIYSDTVEIYNPPTPIFNLGKDTSICEEAELILDASFPYSTYEWQDGSNANSYTVQKEGEYYVTVENCTQASDTIVVETENCSCVIYLPNSFTPDNNATNDVISALATCPVDIFEMIIYNRWGKVVFQTNSINDFWDGNYKNSLTNTDSYNYYLRYSFADDTFVHQKYGHINVLQ